MLSDGDAAEVNGSTIFSFYESISAVWCKDEMYVELRYTVDVSFFTLILLNNTTTNSNSYLILKLLCVCVLGQSFQF